MLKQVEKLAIVGLYALLGLGLSMAVILSARAYSDAENLAASGAAARVACQYIRMKIRQGDVKDAIQVLDDRVYITESYPEGVFRDVLYLHNGALSEQLMADGVDLDETMGDAVLDCTGLQACVLDSGLLYQIGTDYGSCAGFVLIRSGGGS